MKQFRIPPAALQQLFMTADLLHLSFFKHQDAVCHPHCREPVRDQHRRPPPGQFCKTLKNLIFRPGIQSSRRLIQDQQLGIPHICPRQRDLLPFPAGKLDTLPETTPQLLIISVREPLRQLIGKTALRRNLDQRPVFLLLDIAYRDILPHRHLVPQIILKDHPGLAPKIIKGIYAAVAAIRAQNMSIVVVEQDIVQAMAIADRLYCFQEGRVTLTGKPADLSREAIHAAYFGARSLQ